MATLRARADLHADDRAAPRRARDPADGDAEHGAVRDGVLRVDRGKRHRTSTGISAADRATTVLAAIDPATRPADLARPGHMFPLRAREGGVLVRAGQTEAAVDLARIAGLYPAGVICEIMNQDGIDGARAAARAVRQAPPDLLMITIADLIKYRMRTERLVRQDAPRPTCRRATASSASSPTRACSTARRTSRWSGATSATARTCWSASTRGASPAMCSIRPAATAASSSRRRCGASPPRGAACCCTSTRRAAASAWRTRSGPTRCRTRARHGRGQRAPGLQARPARLRDRRADPARPGRAVDAAAHQQSPQVRRPGGLRPVGLRAVPLEIPASDSTRRYLKTKKEKLGHRLTSV